MSQRRISRRAVLGGALGATAVLSMPRIGFPAVKKGTALRMWILKTYVEPKIGRAHV